MISKEYSEAAVEVLDILNHTDEKMVQKIPSKFIDFLKENSSKEYVSNLDHSKKIRDMELKPKTEAILGLIYLKYWADEEGKKKFEQKIKENEEFLANELNNDFNKEVFVNKEIETVSEAENINLPKEYEHVGIVAKIINIIKRIFKGE